MLTYKMLRSRRYQPVCTCNLSLKDLQWRVSPEAGWSGLNICPDYQRGRVWTDEQASRFVGFLAEGGAAPVIFVQRWPMKPDASQPIDEVIDGLQRITALLRFGDNQIPMETPLGERAYLRDFSEQDQKWLRGTSGFRLDLQVVECPTRAAVLELYIRLNRGGTPHSEAEIERVRAMLQAETR